jgi:prefoldin subunit 5
MRIKEINGAILDLQKGIRDYQGEIQEIQKDIDKLQKEKSGLITLNQIQRGEYKI